MHHFVHACVPKKRHNAYTYRYIHTDIHTHMWGPYASESLYSSQRSTKGCKTTCGYRAETDRSNEKKTYTWPWSNKKKTYVQRKREREIRTGKGLLGERDKVNRSWYGW